MPEEKSLSRRSSVCEIKEQSFDFVVVRSADERTLEDILRLEKQCYPDAWQYPDAKEYYEEILKQKESLHIFLREGGVSVGYLLGRPLSEVCAELREYDRDLQDDSACFYLETIGIDTKYAGQGGGAQLLEAFRQEVKNREGGYKRISAHARKAVGSNLSGLIQKMYADASVRHILKWHFGGDEPYDYVVWNIE